LRGADTLVFVSSDGPVAEVMVHHRNVIRAARDSGVAHIVALSGLDADLSSPFCYAVSYGYTEQLLAESGCPVSIARASIYSEFFLGFLVRSRATGQLRLPAADGRVSLVSRADVARCLAALAVAPASGRHHDITGPESLDLAKIAALATREWGTPLEYARIAPSEHCAEMAIAGEDPWWMYAYSTMFASIREQRWAAVSDEIHRLTGCSPTPSTKRSPATGRLDAGSARPAGSRDTSVRVARGTRRRCRRFRPGRRRRRPAGAGNGRSS
jgi:NAD(P)H dehydrogenase (quinone)